MAKTKKQGENSACSALFERAYYSSGYGNYIAICKLYIFVHTVLTGVNCYIFFLLQISNIVQSL